MVKKRWVEGDFMQGHFCSLISRKV